MKRFLVFFLCLILTGCGGTPASSSGNLSSELSSADTSADSSSAAAQSPSDSSAPSPTPPDSSAQESIQPAEPTQSQETPSQELQPQLPQNKDTIIQELISAMSLEEKVGQMFFVRCPESDQATKVSQYKLGGYILFGRDFQEKTAQEVRDVIASYQAAAGIPMLIGTDEEGGTVVRASSNPNLFPSREPSPQVLYARAGWTPFSRTPGRRASPCWTWGSM